MKVRLRFNMSARCGAESVSNATAAAVIATIVLLHPGCSTKPDGSAQPAVPPVPASEPWTSDEVTVGSAGDLAASAAGARAVDSGVDEPSEESAEPSLAADPISIPGRPSDPLPPGPSRSAASAADQMARIMPPEGAVAGLAPGEDVAPLTVASPDDPTAPVGDGLRLELRADLSPQKLTQFLAAADKDMQLIASGRAGIIDPQEARTEMRRIAKLKLEAAKRLSQHPDADAAMRRGGSRGQLQSLSHLAALGDLKSAEALESLAKQNLDSDDPRLVSDSRLVLIGFAIESLQNGDKDAAAQIVSLTDQLAGSSSAPDAAAMMVMGRAREILAQYEYDDEATRVRGAIIKLFAGSADPLIAKMAARFAGNVQSDAIDRLRALMIDGQDVAPERWTEAVEALIDESPDLQTVHYLAGTALELEAFGKQSLAQATYDKLMRRFDDPDAATSREVRLAITARQARQDVMGRQFDPDLPQIDGTSLSISDFRGKVVLMPFWSTRFPESLQLIGRLKTIRDAHADDVTIVGMNLDPAGAPVIEFSENQGFGFPSFRSESAPQVANPVATQFGMVSMPFLAILDKQGRVAALDFNGRNLEATVERLVAE